MSADRGGFFENANIGLGLELLESDRRREPGRAGADDDDVVLHDFAF